MISSSQSSSTELEDDSRFIQNQDDEQSYLDEIFDTNLMKRYPFVRRLVQITVKKHLQVSPNLENQIVSARHLTKAKLKSNALSEFKLPV